MLSGDFPLPANPASCSGMRTWHAQPSVTPRARPALGPSSFAFVSLAQSHCFGEAGFDGWEQRPSPATQRGDPFSPAPPRAAAPRDTPLLWDQVTAVLSGASAGWMGSCYSNLPSDFLTCQRHQSYFLLRRGPRHQGALSLSAGSAAGGGWGSRVALLPAPLASWSGAHVGCGASRGPLSHAEGAFLLFAGMKNFPESKCLGWL